MKFGFQLLIAEKMTENLTGVHTAVSLLRVKSREIAVKKSAWLCLTVLAAGSPDEELLLAHCSGDPTQWGGYSSVK